MASPLLLETEMKIFHAMNARGFSLAELMITIAVIGILSVVSAPMILSYWQTSTLQAGARELATTINLGRQLAITRNTSVCVQLSGTKILMRTGGCAGTIWTGPGTDGAGAIQLESGLQISHIGPDVVFTSLGTANSGVYRVTNPTNGQMRFVLVAVSGRVSVQ